MKVGLYFGTFNPIHVGHLILANYLVQQTDLKQIWFVVTPHNPFKDKQSLLADHHRLNLVKIAVEDNPSLRASDIEFGMQQPNYTIHTLTKLTETYPDYSFEIVMGEDNLFGLKKWYNYEEIIKKFPLHIYPRSSNATLGKRPEIEGAKMQIHENAPMMHISASMIRALIHEKKDVSYLLTEAVFKYVDEMNFYK